MTKKAQKDFGNMITILKHLLEPHRKHEWLRDDGILASIRCAVYDNDLCVRPKNNRVFTENVHPYLVYFYDRFLESPFLDLKKELKLLKKLDPVTGVVREVRQHKKIVKYFKELLSVRDGCQANCEDCHSKPPNLPIFVECCELFDIRDEKLLPYYGAVLAYLKIEKFIDRIMYRNIHWIIGCYVDGNGYKRGVMENCSLTLLFPDADEDMLKQYARFLIYLYPYAYEGVIAEIFYDLRDKVDFIKPLVGAAEAE